jgi:hypothetical protein
MVIPIGWLTRGDWLDDDRESINVLIVSALWASSRMNCPHCNRLLYSRRHKTCGFCGGALPPEFVFSEEKIAELDAEKEAIAERRAQAKAKEEEERQRRSDDG